MYTEYTQTIEFKEEYTFYSTEREHIQKIVSHIYSVLAINTVL